MPGPEAKNDMVKTCVSHVFSCAQFPGGRGDIKSILMLSWAAVKGSGVSAVT